MSDALNNSPAAKETSKPVAIAFRDLRLQRHVELAAVYVTNLPEDLLLICGLMDAYQRFALTDGDDSLLVQEAIEHLLSPDLRPALRSWYRRSSDNINPAAMEFRDQLSAMAGEKFG
jgi:hypothetical protein